MRPSATAAAIAGTAICAVAAGWLAGTSGSIGGLLKLLGVAAALAMVQVAVRRPAVAIVLLAIAAAVPRPVVTLGETLTLTSTDALLVCVSPGLASVWVRRLPGLPPWLKFALIAVPLGALGAVLFTTAALPVAVWGALRWTLFASVIAAAIVLGYQDRGQLRDRLIAVVIGTGTAVAVLGMAQRAGIYTFVGAPYNYPPGRTDSTLGYYSNYSSFLAVAALVAIAFAVSRRDAGARWRLLAVAAAGLMVTEVATNLSRGAVLCLGVGLAVLAVLSLKRPARILWLAVGVALGAWLVSVMVPESVLTEFVNRFALPQGEDITRRSEQAAGWAVLLENPLGIGYLGFPRLVASGGYGVTAALAHTHNLWSQVGVEIGWIGLGGFVVLTAGAAITGLRHAGTPTLPFTVALVAFLAQGWQDYFFVETANFVQFAVLLAGAATSTAAASAAPARRGAVRQTRRLRAHDTVDARPVAAGRGRGSGEIH